MENFFEEIFHYGLVLCSFLFLPLSCKRTAVSLWSIALADENLHDVLEASGAVRIHSTRGS